MQPRPVITIGWVLILISVVLFSLAAFSVDFDDVDIVWLGLAFFAAGHLL